MEVADIPEIPSGKVTVISLKSVRVSRRYALALKRLDYGFF